MLTMTALADAGRRARFEAARERVFSEMKGMTARWRLAMTAPFHLGVIAILAAGGFPRDRLLVQIVASLTVIGGFACIDRFHVKKSRGFFFAGGLALLVSIANTGGLSSPLVLSVVPFFMGISLNPELAHRRRHFVFKFVLVFAVMAWFARKCELPSPLSFATPEYVTIAFASAVLSFIGVYRIGHSMTTAYERIALELAERREELCTENEGRTRALEGIAARLAHEVKNPLAAIKGLSQHMARSADDAKMKERLTIVAAEAERLQEIVDGFLSFSRGLDDLNVEPTTPFAIAHELSLLLETRAADAGMSIEVRGSRELSVSADGRKLRQALLNLVLNAMHASPKGATVTLEIAKSCGDGAAVVRVIDSGAGMTPDVLDRIRKPYYTTKEGGSGLGIAIARGIIEQHGGTLRFESLAGHGTTATVVLPSACGLRAKLPNPCHIAAAAKMKAVEGALVPSKLLEEPVPFVARVDKVSS